LLTGTCQECSCQMCKNHYGAVIADRCFTPLGTGSAPLLFELGTPNLVIAWQVAVGNRAPISVSKRGVMRRVDFYSRLIEFVLDVLVCSAHMFCMLLGLIGCAFSSGGKQSLLFMPVSLLSLVLRIRADVSSSETIGSVPSEGRRALP